MSAYTCEYGHAQYTQNNPPSTRLYAVGHTSIWRSDGSVVNGIIIIIFLSDIVISFIYSRSVRWFLLIYIQPDPRLGVQLSIIGRLFFLP